MTTTTQLLRQRRFLPLFVTQLLGAFNDNLFKNAMVLFAVYSLYNSESQEAAFSGIASALFVIPFVTLSALSGQLADSRDKAAIIRIVKACEIGIMVVGGIGLALAWKNLAVETVAIPLMLLALFAMGVHSTFFGPIKYAILPQHLLPGEVLAGTGLVEAGTYIAILAGTILAGWIPVEWAAVGVVLTAVIGWFAGRQVPPAPPMAEPQPIDYNILRSSITLIRNTTDDRRVALAIGAISFFWAVGTILFIQFPPLAKNVLHASKEVASLFLVIFSIGIAIGSMSINALLKGQVSARFAPPSVMVMGLFVVAFWFVCSSWTPHAGEGLMQLGAFVRHPMAVWLLLALLGIAIAGGMFVVPLYAFLTTFVPPSQTARTIAANNIVNSGAMVVGALVSLALSHAGIPLADQLLVSAGMSVISALLGLRLYSAERAAAASAA
ncbi:MFS transporter [Novosphingobium piscinae]|uniref:MFS transporter n=1 Tax=Novosphingobium piscinae TaxID=1507448 RepID=A0A7X1KNZ0_9SPHN|nr:MFS transporter [Novosphingobium piscinae]MBC2668186.1 MFS transporter [Novosphingobium piscinae]